ncbi:MAG: FKBP-type peptidyl-prolyl cis-trans isomerase [Dysgonamonadaceae bacterium]|jgi:FKBP-type peptidyl-prolyl cis-trans isomerase FklB|nr:FKBP-type peptidyl-prolyl cis-trans isomerase [Dysgonamonadaceae bacterium]
MKKLFNVSLCSLLVCAGITLFSCNAQSPKANLKTDVDTLSYVTGINIVNQQGLGQYVAQQVDSAYLSEFIKGMESSISVDPKNKKAAAYSFGLQIGGQLSQMVSNMEQHFFSGDSTQHLNKKVLYAGIVNALLDKGLVVSKEEASVIAQTLGDKIQKASSEKQYAEVKAENAKWLADNATKEGVVTLDNGLQYKVITEGTGPKPVATDKVKVHYHGTNIKGEVFDSSVERGTPSEFPLNGVIKGWTEGLQLMPVGSKYILYVPYDLAYGEQGRGEKISPYATLIFEVELLEIVNDAQK